MKNKKNILLVEDESSVRSVLFRKLTQKGYHVITSSLYKDAKEFVLSSLNIDLAIVDLHLPDGNGFNLLSCIKDVDPNTETIFLTSFGTVELAVNAVREGAYQFITKPFDLNSFLSIIDGALRKKAVLEGEISSNLMNQESKASFIGKSLEITRTVKLAKRVADSDSIVLITGESGTGKELIAKMVHANSPRSKGPFVAVNCGALSEELLESELFGHKKGSFTGAINDRKGRFCLANNGSLFLDEVGDMSPRLQVKLLRAIQERTYEPVGGQETVSTNARIIAATHKNLEKLVQAGSFREDLYYRLNVIPLNLPALRERKEDILILINYFIKKYNQEKRRNITGISTDAFQYLRSHHWPGNIRELENLIERLTIIKSEGEILTEDLPKHFLKNSPARYHSSAVDFPEGGINFNSVVAEFEDQLILKALNRTGWNKNQAALLLKLNRTTLIEKIKKKNLKNPEKFEEATPFLFNL